MKRAYCDIVEAHAARVLSVGSLRKLQEFTAYFQRRNEDIEIGEQYVW